MTRKSCVFALLIGLLLLSFFFDGEKNSTVIPADRSTSLHSGSLDVNFFYGEGCSHCANVKPFLDDMEQKYPLHIHKYDIYTNRSSISLFDEVCNKYGIEHRGVPAVFVSDTYLVGDTPIIEGFEGVVKNALENPMVQTMKIESAEASSQEVVSVSNAPSILTITVAGLVDSISPCSLAILVFLIGARVLANRKKRILRVGLAFCLSVFIAYFLFGLGLLTVVQLSGFSNIFSLLVGLAAVLVGVFYLKDVFWSRKGGFSMEVPSRFKPTLMKMMKGVATPIGAFLMGFVVVCFELPCTGGPYLFILGQLADSTTRLQAIPLLLYYNFLFVLPLITVSLLLYSNLFSVGNIREWNEKNKHLLKLIGGLTIIALGLLTIPILPMLHSIQTFSSIYKVAGIPLLAVMVFHSVLSLAKHIRLVNRLKGTLLLTILFALILVVPSPANLSVGEARSGDCVIKVEYDDGQPYGSNCPRSNADVFSVDPFLPIGVTGEDGTVSCDSLEDGVYMLRVTWPNPSTQFGDDIPIEIIGGEVVSGLSTIQEDAGYPNGTETCGDSECDGFQYCIIPEDGSPYVECDSWDTECDTKKCCQCDGGTQANPTENYDETQCEDCDPYDLPEVATCTWDPDNNPYTWDYHPAIDSECQDLDTCTHESGYYNYTHTCSVDLCGAECDSNDDCTSGICKDNCTCARCVIRVQYQDGCPRSGADVIYLWPEPGDWIGITDENGMVSCDHLPHPEEYLVQAWYGGEQFGIDEGLPIDENGDGSATITNSSILDTDGNGVGDCYQPQWRNQGQNRSSIGKLQSNYLYAEAKSYELDWAWLSTNEKGYWENTTYMDTNDATSWTWSNFTWQNSSFTGTLSWKIYYNDTSGFTNVTNTMSFKVYDKPPCTNPITGCCVIDAAGTYHLANDISATGDCIVIQADAILLGDNHTISGDGTGIGINITNLPPASLPIIRECKIKNFQAGIFVDETGYGQIIYNDISNHFWGILIYSDENYVFSNYISDNTVGVQADTSWYNEIFNNYFSDNTYNGYTPNDEPNYWNTTKSTGPNIIGGPYIGGNYWSDYDGEDADGDGIGDTTYTVFGGTNKDYLPLIPPHGIAITNITTSKTIVGTEYPVTINITSKNLGLYTETFSITAYANTTTIDTEEITLASKDSTFTIFTWDTTSFEKGNYTISAYATPVPEEIETDDNTHTDGWIIIAMVGDITGPEGYPDGIVDIYDLSTVGYHYGYFAGEPNYNIVADINDDDIVDIGDISLVCMNYGKTDP